jgi:hypothetical protein
MAQGGRGKELGLEIFGSVGIVGGLDPLEFRVRGERCYILAVQLLASLKFVCQLNVSGGLLYLCKPRPLSEALCERSDAKHMTRSDKGSVSVPGDFMHTWVKSWRANRR